MPSFRATLDVHELRPGHAPEEVMASAVDAVGSSHLVEAHRLDIVAGVPRITVRFMVDATSTDQENERALVSAGDMEDAVSRVATCRGLRVLRRSPRGRWLQVT